MDWGQLVWCSHTLNATFFLWRSFSTRKVLEMWDEILILVAGNDSLLSFSPSGYQTHMSHVSHYLSTIHTMTYLTCVWSMSTSGYLKEYRNKPTQRQESQAHPFDAGLLRRNCFSAVGGRKKNGAQTFLFQMKNMFDWIGI